ncbi:hypothetical protein DEU56DRAFT_914878 [Suillus clintonianus]|uniref:uncharacterized protein n=1 Tax=Suillus clintonianus TaxID=1904413 RepID=UPI001B8827BA|nr:uncharacterized protein DEU56DRAFT_914878 [Suillus clintonianus]KAG2130248.1 hypothetical protein DEU56DRAFT_914878 [Suillus clintonianus]
MSVVPRKCSESVSPTLTEFSLAPSTALTTPNSLRLSSVAPPTSAGDKRIAANLTRTEPIAGARVAIPKWLTDTITRLEHELKSQRQKLEEAGDIIHEQAEELVELRHQVTILHDAQNQLEDEVDKSRTSLESLSSNVDVIKKTLQSSTESSKSKAAQAISDNSKDNIWNSGVRKGFLKAIGITKPSAIREYHPHVNGSQIDGDQVRPDFSKDWSDNASWHIHLVQYVRMKIFSDAYMKTSNIMLQTTAAQISSHCQPEGQKERLTQGWHKGKHENECIRDKSNLKTPEWDFAFTLPYQSSDESVQSGDNDRGGIDPETEEDKDVQKKPDTKSNLKGKQKAPSKEAWVTHREKYRALLFNQAVDHLNMVALETKKSSRHHARVIGEPRDRDLPDIKTSARIPIELIDQEWLRACPQDPTRYNGTINDDQVTVPVPEQDADCWHAETEDNFEAELADDEGELGFDEE